MIQQVNRVNGRILGVDTCSWKTLVVVSTCLKLFRIKCWEKKKYLETYAVCSKKREMMAHRLE